MTQRKVHAVLLSVAKPSRRSSRGVDLDRVPDIDEAVDDFASAIARRFSDITITRLKSECATHDAALENLRAIHTSDLVIVLFAGHGAVCEAKAYQSWLLHDTELRDDELAPEITRLAQFAEVVIISDCCYGAGIRRPGLLKSGQRGASARLVDWMYQLSGRPPEAALVDVAELEQFRLSTFARGWRPAALLLKSNMNSLIATTNDIVCLAAAASDDAVTFRAEARFVREIINAMEANLSHGRLADRFEDQAMPASSFQLFIRPNDHMNKPILSPSSGDRSRSET